MTKPSKSHAFQVGIQSDIDGIKDAAYKAASAVNTYLANVQDPVRRDTQVVVSIGSNGPGVGPYSGGKIGFMAQYDDDEFEVEDDVEDDAEIEIDDDEVVESDNDIY